MAIAPEVVMLTSLRSQGLVRPRTGGDRAGANAGRFATQHHVSVS